MEQENISGKQFLELMKSADASEINRVTNIFIQRIALYLTSVMKADDETARDCAQQAFENVYTKIIEESIADVNDIFSYLISSARNEYLAILRQNKVEVPNEYSYFTDIMGTTEEETAGYMYSEEKEQLLVDCINKLKKGKRTFFLQVLKFINEKDKNAAKKLNMSHSSFRTRKSRVIDTLRKCIKNTVSK